MSNVLRLFALPLSTLKLFYRRFTDELAAPVLASNGVKNGAVEIWAVTEAYGTDYYVYGVTRDPIVCPSLGMAREKAAA